MWRWLAAAVVALVVLSTSAVVVARVHLEGPALARVVCDRLNDGAQGRIAIASIEWPLDELPAAVRGGWLPVTVREVEIWDRDGVSVARSELITAELDVHALFGGRADLVLRRVRVHGGRVLLREVREAQPLHDYDVTAISLLTAFDRPAHLSYRIGVVATTAPRLDVPDLELIDVDIEARVLHVDEHARRHQVRVSIGDVSARGAFLLDNSDPLISRFTAHLTGRGGAGHLDLFVTGDERGELSFPLAGVEVRRLEQRDETLTIDIAATSTAGARAQVTGALRDWWSLPYGGTWDVRARVDDAGPMLRTSVERGIRGDDVTLEAEVRGPFAFYPSVTVRARGLGYQVDAVEPPVAITLDEIRAGHDFAVDEGASEPLVARVAGGAVTLAARWGGDGSDEAPRWIDADAAIDEPLELRPWLPPALVREAGSRLTGRAHVLRRKGGRIDGITVDELALRLGRMRIGGGEIYVDHVAERLVARDIAFALPWVHGTTTCVLDAAGLACGGGQIISGDAMRLYRALRR